MEEFNSFKAQSALQFLQADKDGGNLLDLTEINDVFKKMGITVEQKLLEAHIAELNERLYESGQIVRPNSLVGLQLTSLGFDILLRFYSSDRFLGEIFSKYCPLYRFRPHNSKNNHIMTIVNNILRPLMSAPQLADFIANEQGEKTTEQECQDIIKKFPCFDLQGKERNQSINMLSLSDFTTLLRKPSNSLFTESKPSLQLTLADCYILTDTSLASKDVTLEQIKHALIDGYRCFRLQIVNGSSQNRPVLKPAIHIGLDDFLQNVAQWGFQQTKFPIILMIDNKCSLRQAPLVGKLLANMLEDKLYLRAQPDLEMDDQNEANPSEGPNNQDPSIFVRQNAAKSKGKQPKLSQLMQKVIVRMKIDAIITADSTQNSLLAAAIASLNSVCALNALNRIETSFKPKLEWSSLSLSTLQLAEYHQQPFQQPLTDYCRHVLLHTVIDPQNTPLLSFALSAGIQCIGIPDLRQGHSANPNTIFEGLETCTGYIAKPSWLQQKTRVAASQKAFNKRNLKIKLKILSGRNLNPQNNLLIEPTNINNTSKIVLNASLNGCSADTMPLQNYRSAVFSNYFYSDIDLPCQFIVHEPESARVTLSLIDLRSNQLLASRTIGVQSLKPGFRSLELIDREYNSKKRIKKTHVYVECRIENLTKQKILNFQQKGITE